MSAGSTKWKINTCIHLYQSYLGIIDFRMGFVETDPQNHEVCECVLPQQALIYSRRTILRQVRCKGT